MHNNKVFLWFCIQDEKKMFEVDDGSRKNYKKKRRAPFENEASIDPICLAENLSIQFPWYFDYGGKKMGKGR